MKRLLIMCFALAFVVGAIIEFTPSSMAQTDIGLRADVSAGGAWSKTPCTGAAPSCIDHCGCIAASALPISPPAPPVAFGWTLVAYDLAAASLFGLSVEPELAPPIFAA